MTIIAMFIDTDDGGSRFDLYVSNAGPWKKGLRIELESVCLAQVTETEYNPQAQTGTLHVP
jgi:hypothetical protein